MVGVVIFLAHDFSRFVSGSYATERLDVSAGKIIEDFMKTGKRDPFQVSYEPIKEIGNNYIIYQVVTPDGKGNIFSGSKTKWGDGKKIGRYIRLGIEGDGNLWRSSGDYVAGNFTKKTGEILVPEAEFEVKGITIDGEVTNVIDLIDSLSFKISCKGRDGKEYSRRYVVRLRN